MPVSLHTEMVKAQATFYGTPMWYSYGHIHIALKQQARLDCCVNNTQSMSLRHKSDKNMKDDSSY